MVNNLFSSFSYAVMNDFVFKNKREVKVLFIYQKRYNVVISLMIKKSKRHSDETYYKNEAEKIINKMIKNGSLKKYANESVSEQKRSKRFRFIYIPLSCAFALASVGTAVYFTYRQAPVTPPEPVDPLRTKELTFTCEAEGSLILDYSSYYDVEENPIPTRSIDVSYKVDDGEWTKMEVSQHIGDPGSATIYQYPIASNLEVGQKVYIRGNNDYWSYNYVDDSDNLSNESLAFVAHDEGEFSVSNNVMSLLSENNFAKLDTVPTAYCFYSLFSDYYGDEVANISDASNLYLPSNLSEGCYNYMFYKNENLTKTPELPATIVPSNCYDSMFYGCSSLTEAPSLPATTLNEGCYFCMFEECSSLVRAPELPATTLAEWCYTYMFMDCTSLTQVPSLPARTLVDYCYAQMFYNCSLLNVSENSGSNLIFAFIEEEEGAEFVTNSMFAGTAGTFTSTPTVGNSYYWN